MLVRRSGESDWIEVSQGLDASAKIYGYSLTLKGSYRVDALHSDTYKIRGGLYRNMKEEEREEAAEESRRAKVRVSLGYKEVGEHRGREDAGRREQLVDGEV